MYPYPFWSLFMKECLLLFQQIHDILPQRVKGGLGGRRPGDNHVQPVFHIPQMGPEAFPQAALDPVTGHGVACFLADGKPDLQLPARGKKHDQIAAGDRMSSTIDILERPVFLQPITSFHSFSFRSARSIPWRR